MSDGATETSAATSELEVVEREIASGDGTKLWWRAWRLPDGAEAKARLLIVHGRGEHGGRYEHVARALAARGIASMAVDYRGFGKAGGTRGGVRAFSEYLGDIDAAITASQDEPHAEQPLFAFGHSLGGAILVRWGQERGGAPGGAPAGPVAGVALSSPFLAMPEPPGAVKTGLLKLGASLSPDKEKRSGGTRLTRDEAFHESGQNDPLGVPFYTLAWAREMLAAQKTIFDKASAFRLPLLIQQGGADPVAAPDGARRFHVVAGSEDKTLEVYEGLLHEVVNELPADREKVIRELGDWILARR